MEQNSNSIVHVMNMCNPATCCFLTLLGSVPRHRLQMQAPPATSPYSSAPTPHIAGQPQKQHKYGRCNANPALIGTGAGMHTSASTRRTITVSTTPLPLPS